MSEASVEVEGDRSGKTNEPAREDLVGHHVNRLTVCKPNQERTREVRTASEELRGLKVEEREERTFGSCLDLDRTKADHGRREDELLLSKEADGKVVL